jgi:hypothetical protein
MPIANCTNCKKGFDFDGFFESGERTLFYCECGKVYDMGPAMLSLVEVPIEEVDLTNVIGWPIPEELYGTSEMSRGLFIKKSRWKKASTKSA